MRSLKLTSTSKPDELKTNSEWLLAQNITLCLLDLKDQSALSAHKFNSVIFFVLRRIFHQKLWAMIAAFVISEFAEAVGTPWKWLAILDSRPKLSLGTVQDMHTITLHLAEEYFGAAYGYRLLWECHSNWLIPHKTKLQATAKEANFRMEATFQVSYELPDQSTSHAL